MHPLGTFGRTEVTFSCVGALIAFMIVVYQQIENYVLQPTIIGRAARVSGSTVGRGGRRVSRNNAG